MSGRASRRARGWRRIALLLVALSLLARVAIPSGWMPAANAAGLTFKWCADAGGSAALAEAGALLAKATGKPPPLKAKHGSDQPCAFAAAALPFAPSNATPVPVPAVRQGAQLIADFRAIPGRGLVAPPPFARGPPLHA